MGPPRPRCDHLAGRERRGTPGPRRAHRPPGGPGRGHGSRSRGTVRVRETAAPRGLLRGVGVKYVLIGVVVALLALRLWRRVRVRRLVTDPSGRGATVPPRRLGAALDRVGGDIGLVARREGRERVRGRTFGIGAAVILLAVAAAVTIPVL